MPLSARSGSTQRGVLREDFFGIKRGSNADQTRDQRGSNAGCTRDVCGMRVGVYAGYRGISWDRVGILWDRVGISWDRVGSLQPREIFFVVLNAAHSQLAHTTQMHCALLEAKQRQPEVEAKITALVSGRLFRLEVSRR